METLIRFILKKRNIWFHIILTFFTYGIWILIYFTVKLLYKIRQAINTNISINNNSSEIKSVIKVQPQAVDKLEPLFYMNFNVAGVSFRDKENDRQKNIKLIVKDGITNGYLEKYDGYTNKEILEYNINDLGEVANQKVYTDFKITTFQDTFAVEVYLIKYTDRSDKLFIGYVPKTHINDFLNWYKTDYKIVNDSSIVGGKYKYIDFDSYEDKEVINSKELTYGINIKLSFFEK